MASSLYEFTVKTIDGKKQSMGAYKGNVLLIVNTASQCGFTPQYKGLEALYEKLHGKGLEILGFPCNQFGAQEPGEASRPLARTCRYGLGNPAIFEVLEGTPCRQPRVIIPLLMQAPNESRENG